MVGDASRLIKQGLAETERGEQQRPQVIGLNDTQLVVLVAALVSDIAIDPKHAVSYAVELVAEGVVAMQSGAMLRALEQVRTRKAVGE